MTAIATGRAVSRQEARHPHIIRAWLLLVAAMVVGIVIVGGVTRLTNSGLSITEWKPIKGVIPPLNDSEWAAEFEKYKQIPQYVKMNLGMSLDDFKFIYWWEWSHRLLARLVGIVVIIPLVFFTVCRWVNRSLFWKLMGLFLLGASQGALGWWMVASGLSERTEVSQYRLAMHMTLACIIFTAIIWVWSSLKLNRESGSLPVSARWIAASLVPLALVQIFMGGLVAGLRAGYAYNSWPLMDGHFIPAIGNLYIMTPAWANHFENALTVQFQHRMMAYLIVALAILQALLALRHGEGMARRRAVLIAWLALGQGAIGIMTLLLVVPLWAGIMHQLGGIILLAAVTIHAQRLTMSRRGQPKPSGRATWAAR